MEGTGRMTEIKIVTWNCDMKKGKFSDKLKEVVQNNTETKNADVYIIQECPKPDMQLLESLGLKKEEFWDGVKGTKRGVGIFIQADYSVNNSNKDDKSTIDDPYQFSVSCTIDNKQLKILGIWANTNTKKLYWAPDLRDHLKRKLKNDKFDIIAGDLNLDISADTQNVFSDKKYQEYKADYDDIYNILSENGLESAYHEYYGIKPFIKEQADKEEKTFYLYRSKPTSHLDYVFSNKKVKDAFIGDEDFWLKHSDHRPLIVTLEL
jgi:exonuclease III